MSRGISKLTASAVCACGALLATALARAVGAKVPASLIVPLGAAVVVLAAAVAVRTVASAWRGPIVVPFSPDEAVVCDPGEAERIRRFALLRGTMGGAGYVSRGRLAYPAITWFAVAATAAAAFIDPTFQAWPIAILAVSLGASLLLPARPFYYREATGGRIVVHPPAARDCLARNGIRAHSTR